MIRNIIGSLGTRVDRRGRLYLELEVDWRFLFLADVVMVYVYVRVIVFVMGFLVGYCCHLHSDHFEWSGVVQCLRDRKHQSIIEIEDCSLSRGVWILI